MVVGKQQQQQHKNYLLLFEYPANCRFCGGCCCCLPPDGGFTSGVCIVVKFSASKDIMNLVNFMVKDKDEKLAIASEYG